MSTPRSKQVTEKRIPRAPASAAEHRAIKRGRAEAAAGETVPYELYRAEHSAGVQRKKPQTQVKLRAHLKEGALKHAQRDREIAAEWDHLSAEAWAHLDRMEKDGRRSKLK